MNETIELNPKEYGLEVKEASVIEGAFKPVITELDGVMEIYQELITSDITNEICERAGKLSTVLSKVNSSHDRVHKAQKAYFWAGGKFVDALKNKNKVVIDEMQLTLKSLKNHFANLEAEKVEKLNKERQLLCIDFVENEDMILSNLGGLSDDLWNNYFTGLKVSHNARIEAEKKAEEDRIEAEKAKIEEDKRIRAENERLEKEAKKAELKRIKEETERKRIEDIRLAKEEDERLEREKEAEKKRLEYEEKLQAEREAREKETEESAILQAQLNAENQEKERRLKALKEAERVEKQRLLDIELAKKKAEKSAQLAPDKDKLLVLANSIMSIEIPILKAKEANDIMLNLIDLLSKIDTYIKEKVNNL